VEAADVRAPLLCISLLHQKKTLRSKSEEPFQKKKKNYEGFGLFLQDPTHGPGHYPCNGQATQRHDM
jgi:hypothetical protein